MCVSFAMAMYVNRFCGPAGFESDFKTPHTVRVLATLNRNRSDGEKRGILLARCFVQDPCVSLIASSRTELGVRGRLMRQA